MSKYTTEVRYICESFASLDESKGYSSVNEIIQNSRDKIFDFDYPIFDEGYRSVLETKILKHYYTREIGSETVGLWKLWLDTKMNEIMPYYNKLYKSELIKIDPMVTDTSSKMGSRNEHGTRSDDGIESTHEKNNSSQSGSNVNTSYGSGESTQSGINVTENINKFSDTPSGALNGVLNNTYLTNATQNNNKDTNTNTSTNNNKNNEVNTVNNDTQFSRDSNNVKTNAEKMFNTSDYIDSIVGHSGISESKLLKEYRDTFLNIDMRVINELSDLFMNLW